MSIYGVTIRLTKIHFRPQFCCDTCGVVAEGDMAQVEQEYALPTKDDLKINVSPTYMPPGWAAYGRMVHRCPKCIV